MNWKFNTEINEKIQELQEETKKVEHEIQIIEEYRKEFSAIHTKFNHLYGNKYGINQRKVNRKIEFTELERMMHLIRAEDAQPQKKSFLGLGGLKREDYTVFTDKLNLVVSNLEFIIEDWNSYLANKINELETMLDNYKSFYEKDSVVYDLINKTEKYDSSDLKEGNEILLGTVEIEVPKETHIVEIFQKKQYSFYSEGQLHMFTKMSLKEMPACYIQYENEAQLEMIHTWIRSLYKQLLCSVLPFHGELLYLDGLYSASGLKEFLSLQTIYEEYVPELEERLFADDFRILQVKRDKDGICNALQNLEQYMGMVTDILQGNASFAVYNENHKKKIPYRFVVLEGMDTYTDFALLRKLLKNASTCGISIIYLQDAKLIKKEGIGNKSYSEMMELFSGFPQIIFESEKICFRQGTKTYRYKLLQEETGQLAFVNHIQKQLGTKTELDNNFKTYFNENYQWGQYTSTIKLPDGRLEGKIEIPFALDKRGRITSFELGSANYAHGLISGGTGSGKTTMLHMIISSVIMNYHPKDVEIWLADYKQTEMSVYINNRPPHVKFIGIESNEEFSFSLIKLAYNEYKRRNRMFVKQGVKDIDAYKEKFGINSLPRILLIIDEFHVMAQQIYENPTYSLMLENLLSESRSTGFVCLFADQSVRLGLKGLTEKGKEQMMQRLAMKANDPEEISVTLNMKVTNKDVALEKGEVLQRKLVTKVKQDGTLEKDFVLEMNKVIFISSKDRENVVNKAKEIYGKGEEAIIVDGKAQEKIDWEKATQYEKNIKDERELFYLHLGKPSNFEACYTIPLFKNYGQNIICLHEKFHLQELLLIHAITSFLRYSHSKVYVLADENDVLYRSARVRLRELKEHNSNLIVVSDMEAVCETILELSDTMVKRRGKFSREADLILWIGLDNILKEFTHYGVLPKERKNSSKSRLDRERESVEQNMQKFFGDDFFGREISNASDIIEKEESLLFDASEQVEALLDEGAKRGFFQFVFMSEMLPLRKSKILKLDYFTYKMSGYLNRDDSAVFYGTSKFMESMKSDSDDNNENRLFVCYDKKKARFFVPYND